MYIEIYSKDNCPFCQYAIQKAEQMNATGVATYKKYNLGEDFNREELLNKFPSAKTFPQITVDGVSIGGWTEFNKEY
jgi:glutaredoxin-related protein